MAIPSQEEVNLIHTHICQAVGDPTRLRILYALHEQPQNVTALAETLDIPQPTISRHLGVLRQRSIVVCEREGNTVIYYLSEPRIIDILNVMRQMLRDILDRQTGILE